MPVDPSPPLGARTPTQQAAPAAQRAVHPAIAQFARRIEAILSEQNPAQIPKAVAEALRPVVATPNLLTAEQQQPGEKSYRRHVLYGDPDGRFTVLALVWMPGQTTPIHGHSAWGAVGVYEGAPNVSLYRCEEKNGLREAHLTRDLHCRAGEVSCVSSGYDDVHRIYNDSKERVLTIHAYGRDLIKEPESINLVISR